MESRKLPKGVSDFKELIENNFLYADKTLFIKNVIEDSKVILLPRPRRFGKTLNMSMLRYYFEKNQDNKDNLHLFKNLKISQSIGNFTSWAGKHPVICLTFKDAKQNTWNDCQQIIINEIANEFYRHKYLLNSDFLEENHKRIFQEILTKTAPWHEIKLSLQNLVFYLFKYYNEKVIVLIDEYDSAIHAGYVNNFYDETIDFFRTFLGAALKDNVYLQKGVLTGILRVAKESIFSGLNNISVYTLTDNEYSDFFGFTEEEVAELNKYGEHKKDLDVIKNWYNGYVFGDKTIFNPWSVIHYLDSQADTPKPYWLNSADNSLVIKLLKRNSIGIKEEVQKLLHLEAVEKKIIENMSFSSLDNDDELIWSFLLYTGYLKASKKRLVLSSIYATLSIPNTEICEIYNQLTNEWLFEKIGSSKVNEMLSALTEGNIETFGLIFSDFVLQTFSSFDTRADYAEAVYHSFALGLFVHLAPTHLVKSNRESGSGRYDVMLIPHNKSKIGIIIEFKLVKNKENIQTSLDAALNQISEKQYVTELSQLGIVKNIKLAIAFKGKKVYFKSESSS